jgi:hypothetical protein
MITNFEYLGADKLHAFTGHHQAIVNVENDQTNHTVIGLVFDDNANYVRGVVKDAVIDLDYHLTDFEHEQLESYMLEALGVKL